MYQRRVNGVKEEVFSSLPSSPPPHPLSLSSSEYCTGSYLKGEFNNVELEKMFTIPSTACIYARPES